MAKQSYSTVDESELLSLVSRGQQPYRPVESEEPDDDEVGNTRHEPEEKPMTTKEKTEKVPKKRKSGERSGEKDYDEVFLVRMQSVQRCQTYIDRDIYSLIKNFLSVVASDISITAYINNILNDHLDEYWDMIHERYNSALAKPLSRK